MKIIGKLWEWVLLAKYPTKLLLCLLLVVLTAQACMSEEPPATPTFELTAEPTAVAPTSTPAPQPSATPIPPTATPTAEPTPCVHPLQPDLADYWQPGLIGCPISSGATAISTAYAPFEGGQMLWRGDTDTIYVLFNDGRWQGFANEWREGDSTFTCGEEIAVVTPIRGFGRVWCDHPDVRAALGNATAKEIGDSASAVQDFGNGVILLAPFGGVFVFVNEDSTWRRVDD